MNWCAIVLTGGLVLGQTPTAPTTTPPQSTLPPASLSEPVANTEWSLTKTWCGSTSGFLRGDQDFGRFIHPVTNPVFAKDPRASTQLRGLFIHDTIPGDHPVGGGNFQAAALQANIAVNERLTIIADKDGYLWFNPGAAPSSSGFLNLGVGLKYSFIRDVENQFIVSGGFMYEIPSGEADAFSGHGNGAFAFFVTTGKEFAERFHFLNTTGYYVPVNSNQNSSFFYTSFHLAARGKSRHGACFPWSWR